MTLTNMIRLCLIVLWCAFPLQAGAGEVYGSPQDPLVAKVLGIEVHTRDAEEMRYVILSKLVDCYTAEHSIEVSQEEIDAYLAGMRRKAEEERRSNLEQREELTRRLNSQDLTDAEKESISAKLKSVNELIATLEGIGANSKKNSEEIRQDREKVAGAFIRQWKINKALWEQYGGRVIFQQGGPEPLDAYRHFLELQEKAGNFIILNKAFEKKFWNYYRNDAIHRFYAKESDEARAFETPWWLE